MISALFVQENSIYKKLNIDSWDKNRNAYLWPGQHPIICHPPCRSWGKLKHFAKPEIDEHFMAIWSIKQIRLYGGILEHPSGSQLWKELQLPTGKNTDEYGGYTISINQSWFDHPAEKRTLLYICGINRNELPVIPLNFNMIEYSIAGTKNKHSLGYNKKSISHHKREATPVKLAKWMIEVCNLIDQKSQLKARMKTG